MKTKIVIIAIAAVFLYAHREDLDSIWNSMSDNYDSEEEREKRFQEAKKIYDLKPPRNYDREPEN